MVRRTVKRRATRKAVRRKTAAARKGRRRSLNIKVSPHVAREIWSIVFACLGIIGILSIQGSFGIVGELWMKAFSPVIGFGVYILPAVFFLVAGMMFASKKIEFTPARILGIFLFMVSILSIFHLSVPADEILQYASDGRYGGYTGFVTNFLLLEVLEIGNFGSAVIFVAILVTSIMLVFDVSLKDLYKFMIPQVQIEMVDVTKDRKTRKQSRAEKNEDPNQQPLKLGESEITIHKALIGGNEEVKAVNTDQRKHGKIEVMYEEDEKPVDDSESKVSDQIAWEFPSLDLLQSGNSKVKVDEKFLMKSAEKIKGKLQQFGIDVAMNTVNVGPTVVQYTLKPDEGVKLSKITGLKNDLALALAAERIRIEAPIPGKSLVGIEVPNDNRATVHLREILESKEFRDTKSKLSLPLGRDVSGKPIIGNLERMPHLLIAGATGSGKSVAMNSFLISLLYQNSPKDLKFIMIDPKRVELSSYNSIPHLLSPVIEDPGKAAVSLRWVVAEMTRRYGELSTRRVRNIFEYNDLKDVNKLPRIIVVIDELADLMMTAGKEVEAAICRIAQMARAVGIHLIIATQRPSVDVITGLIKANIPSRISFAVSSSIDSRTILDATGAEDLLGRGDMLYLPTGVNRPVRVQGIYISTEEIERVTNRLKLTKEPVYNEEVVSSATASKSVAGVPDPKKGNSDDVLYEKAFNLVRETRKASASMLQRRLKVGYARAARLIDMLEDNGVVGPSNGAKARKILVD
jgi:S-DNA-T family DNA segregation ATPase FtsK/SpoIIIE